MRYLVLSLCLLATLSGASQAEPLDVKAGLWETTTSVEKKRAKQPTNLDQLTPEQRAKVEAKLAHQVKTETHTNTACLSEERIKSGEAFTGNATHRGTCEHEFETQTANELVASVECRGANRMTGTVRMHAVDSEHMSGVVEMTYGSAGQLQMMTRSELTSKWLKADCGASAEPSVHSFH
jgi:uncharacterized protein with NAD-binding domain and iron-sulfur cluster